MKHTSMRQEQPQEAIVLSENVYHSNLGEYFLGQTDIISFGEGYNGWGGLVNPKDSRVNMFLNAYTITNYSDETLTAEAWLTVRFPEEEKHLRILLQGTNLLFRRQCQR